MKKVAKNWIYPLTIMVVVLMIVSGCKKEEDNSTPPPAAQIPVLTTSAVSNIAFTTADCGGNVTSKGTYEVTARGVCWSTSSNPSTSDSHTTDGSGTGVFTSKLSGLIANTQYYFRAYAKSYAGTAYGNLLQFKTLPVNIETVKDIDGNVYHTVTIGTQTWMVENLKTTKYNNGTAIPLVTDWQKWMNLSAPGYCWFNNNASNKNTYGALYNAFVVNTKKLAPTGWHVPTYDDWSTLVHNLGGETVAGGKMKSTVAGLWNSPNTGATNETGFSAVPAGYRNINGEFKEFKSNGYWWTTTLNPGSAGLNWAYSMSYSSSSVDRFYGSEQSGYSVRCIRD